MLAKDIKPGTIVVQNGAPCLIENVTVQTFIPPGHMLVEEDDETASNDVVARLASLTNQQGRILQLICEGKLNKQIAYDLSIAETTVKAHVTAIMRKLGVQSRTQAMLLA